MTSPWILVPSSNVPPTGRLSQDLTVELVEYTVVVPDSQKSRNKLAIGNLCGSSGRGKQAVTLDSRYYAPRVSGMQALDNGLTGLFCCRCNHSKHGEIIRPCVEFLVDVDPSLARGV